MGEELTSSNKKPKTVNQNSGWATLTDYPIIYPDTIPIHPNSMNRKGFESI